jgi:hypothetical protein
MDTLSPGEYANLAIGCAAAAAILNNAIEGTISNSAIMMETLMEKMATKGDNEIMVIGAITIKSALELWEQRIRRDERDTMVARYGM